MCRQCSHSIRRFLFLYLDFVSHPKNGLIDAVLAECPAVLDKFFSLIKRGEYEVKDVRGGGISFRLTRQGQECFTRQRASMLPFCIEKLICGGNIEQSGM